MSTSCKSSSDEILIPSLIQRFNKKESCHQNSKCNYKSFNWTRQKHDSHRCEIQHHNLIKNNWALRSFYDIIRKLPQQSSKVSSLFADCRLMLTCKFTQFAKLLLRRFISILPSLRIRSSSMFDYLKINSVFYGFPKYFNKFPSKLKSTLTEMVARRIRC